MKITYRGGYNKNNEESVKKSSLNCYNDKINYLFKEGKKIALVTAAMPKGYYLRHIKKEILNKCDVIERDSPGSINWQDYNLIIILGGDTKEIYESLKSKEFNLNKLKANVELIGDSAGAFVLSHWYPDHKYKLDKKDNSFNESVAFHRGFLEKGNFICAVHYNRLNEFAKFKIKEFADANSLEILKLNENEFVEKRFVKNNL
jgi:peptidase E